MPTTEPSDEFVNAVAALRETNPASFFTITGTLLPLIDAANKAAKVAKDTSTDLASVMSTLRTDSTDESIVSLSLAAANAREEAAALESELSELLKTAAEAQIASSKDAAKHAKSVEAYKTAVGKVNTITKSLSLIDCPTSIIEALPAVLSVKGASTPKNIGTTDVRRPRGWDVDVDGVRAVSGAGVNAKSGFSAAAKVLEISTLSVIEAADAVNGGAIDALNVGAKVEYDIAGHDGKTHHVTAYKVDRSA